MSRTAKAEQAKVDRAQESAKQILDLSIEVPATPEQVWRAIATGPGISAWLIPAKVEERAGGTVTMYHGGGDDPEMNSESRITTWDPPRTLVYEDEWGESEDGSPSRLATEFHVEARGGGTCRVRLVCHLFGGGAGWEDELEGMKTGWVGYLEILRLYLTHFPGLACTSIYVTGTAPSPKAAAQTALTAGLGLEDGMTGERASASVPGAATLTGRVEKREADQVTLLLDDASPAPGILLVYVFEMGERVVTAVHAYLYGETGRVVAERDGPAWQAWMASRFPDDAERTASAVASV